MAHVTGVFTELIEEIGVKDCQVEELYVLDQENLQRLKYVSTNYAHHQANLAADGLVVLILRHLFLQARAWLDLPLQVACRRIGQQGYREPVRYRRLLCQPSDQ